MAATSAIVVTADDSERDQRAAAGALAARGLGPGDRIAIIASGTPAYLAVALGALRTGIVPVLLNPNLLADEQHALLVDADPTLTVRADDLDRLLTVGSPAELAPWPWRAPCSTRAEPQGSRRACGAACSASATPRRSSPRSGRCGDSPPTTSISSHRPCTTRRRCASRPAPCSPAVRWCSPVRSRPRPSPTPSRRTGRRRPSSRPRTSSGSSRSIGHRLSTRSASSRTRARLVRTLLKEHALDAFPAGAVWEFYGSTEGQFTVCSPEEWVERPGTVGRARPGRTLRADPEGTIWCSVPDHARFEYWRDPIKTAQTWRNDAFTVGDLGRIDADGYLYLDGRRDDLVITGGMNVYPLEVERVLLAHPDVQEAVVFGADDERWGRRVCAAIVGDLDSAEVHEWLAGRVAPYKRPKQVLVVDEIPVGPTGKVRRSRLAATLGLEAGS